MFTTRGSVLTFTNWRASPRLCVAVVLVVLQSNIGTLSAFEYTGKLNQRRADHTATLLRDGKVLVAGGYQEARTGNSTNSAELFDPASGTWTPTGTLNTPREAHLATLLHDGTVLIAGGNSRGGRLASTERYNPATGSWTLTGNLNTAREYGSQATLLGNGKVLVTGGYRADQDGALASAELYDPASGMWMLTGSMNVPRYGHTATLLADGKVLVAAGRGPLQGAPLGSAEVYDPATGNWKPTGSLSTARALHAVTLLPDGRVLVVGGDKANVRQKSAELYDPSTGTWTPTGSLTTARFLHTATLLPNGRVLVAGGYQHEALDSAELYDPPTGSWVGIDGLNEERCAHTATLLPNGKVLVAAGIGFGQYPSAELSDAKAYSSVAVSSTPNPSEKGEMVTLTARVTVSVGTATGTVQFKDNGENLGTPQPLNATGSASFSTSSLAIGAHNITAEYSGDSSSTASSGTLTGGQIVYAASTLANISTRLRVGTADHVLIAGFIIDGAAPKKVVIRALGPSLDEFGVQNPLANPQLELHSSSGTIALNNDWQTTQTGGVITGDQSKEIAESGLAPTESAESAIIATLTPGSYTAVVRGVADTTGVGLVEVYDLSERGSPARVANISTRGYAQPGDQALIGGIIIIKQTTRMVIRAIGPSLRRSGIGDALANPQLELHDANERIATNDNWQTTQTGGVITSDQTAELLDSQLAPTDAAESAMIVTLEPGTYTAVITGVNDTSGIALVEAYALK